MAQHIHERLFFAQHRSNTSFGSRATCEAAVHQYSALSFFTDGAATLEQQGLWSLSAGDIALIPAGAPHRLLGAGSASFFGVGFLASSLQSEGLGEFLPLFDAVIQGGAAKLNVKPERREFLRGLFLELNTSQHANVGPTVQKSLLALILSEAKRSAAISPPPALPSIVVQALQYIEKSCLRPISLVDVASAVGRSPAYLTTSVKQQTGRSVQEWIIAGRLKETQRLLKTQTSLDEIALRVGYSDTRHLTRLFSREYNETPTQYRARHKMK